MLDTTEIFPVALEALDMGDTALDEFWYRHAPSCLGWGAEGYAVVTRGSTFGSHHAVFSSTGELLLVCGPCQFNLSWMECCGPL